MFKCARSNRIRPAFFAVIAACLCLTSALAGCSSAPSGETDGSGGGSARSGETFEDTHFALDTVCTIRVYDAADEPVIDECFDLIDSYEALLSRTAEGSDVWRINHAYDGRTENPDDPYAYTQVSDDTAYLIGLACELSDATDGAYDVTIAPVSELWDFSSGEGHVPDAEALAEAVAHVDYRLIRTDLLTTPDGDGGTFEVSLDDPEAGIDLGSIAKGYIADRVCALLRERGVENALVNLGGNISVIGSKPDGSGYAIGIQEPFADHSSYIGYSVISDLSAVTTGIYERCFEEDGVLYHHILDPRTGYPFDNGLVSVTVFGPEAAFCDALSTACFTQGPADGAALVESFGGYYAVFIDGDGTLYYSDGFLENIGLELN
ncbi:MAG: FAD:protein FMN transferase [Lachnospiraceae bacterium]|nr:FAD:protein FMN transferase [Lachnospiraceae bacterium]